ncbi:NUDIX hydrolase [Nocardia sp. NPDC004654]|uniref:NUDIX hydrolase n=1 Tax=Nocardia sp. NPDC004654 TaxID=3154776 RepID=UPI00339E4E1E
MIEEPPLTTVQSGQVVYDGKPWLSVSRHRITTPDGVERSHHAVRLNPVATATIIDEHGRALLLRRHRWIVDQIGFESPGGILDHDEEPEACARRELLEETGFTADELVLAAVLEPMPGLVETPHYIYIGRGPRQVGEPADLEETGQLVWVPLAQTGELLAKAQLLGTGTAVGMLAALALHGSGEMTASSDQQVVASPKPSRAQHPDALGGVREQ